MDISTLANLINAIAVTAGVIFAAAQIREFRRRRRRQSMYTLVQTFQGPDFTKALHRIINLPDNLDRAAICAKVGPEGEDAIYFVTTTWETIGVLVFQRELTLDLVDDFFSGPIVLSWRKLARYLEEMRREQHRDTLFEWYQWLAERMIEREKKVPAVPAHIAHAPGSKSYQRWLRKS
jgi:superfamily I DNA/RNA helicase